MVHETRHLCIGNLPQNVIEQDILDLFKPYGKINKIKTNKLKQQAIITFNDVESALRANSKLELYLNGHLLKITFKDTKLLSSSLSTTK
jgi:RNA recognition motif-containing protein